MSLIERAAERLDRLPSGAGDPVPEAAGAAPTAAAQPVPVAAEPAPVYAQRGVTYAPAHEGRQCNLDFRRLREAGYLTPDSMASVLAEEFRVIKRPLLANVERASSSGSIPNANLIMVTSAIPGEGKSFTAINLAIAIAMELDRTVLLVDADVARPSLLRNFGIPQQDGLLDVLRGKYASVGDVLMRTNIDKLTLLPAGMPGPNATELLASQAMDRLLREISTRYANRIVIFDAPPLLPTTEARVLASGMGQIAFVVRAETTPRAAVRDALATIEACDIKLMILNQARRIENGAYGYGSYGYEK